MDQQRRWRLAVRAVSFVVCTAIVLAIAARWERVPYGQLLVGCATSIGALLLTAFFVRGEGLRLNDVGAQLVRGSLPRFAAAFLGGLTLPFLRAGIGMLLTHTHYENSGSFTVTAALLSLATYVALACREELAFRGYPLRRLESGFGTWPAQLLIAALFATEHVLGGWTWKQALLGAGVGSILFGAAALRTRGLAVPIGLHAAWNFGDWMLGGKETAGLWKPVLEMEASGHAGTIQMVSYLAVMITATAVVWFWPRGSM